MYSALARLAVKQNESEWWDSIKDDEKELSAVVKSYCKICPDTTHGKPRGNFKVSQYRHSWSLSRPSSNSGASHVLNSFVPACFECSDSPIRARTSVS